jgi:hypothetical protein
MGLTLLPSNIGAQQGTIKQQLVDTATIPDFSGIWARVSFPGFGRPLAGAGPVINKNRTPNADISHY